MHLGTTGSYIGHAVTIGRRSPNGHTCLQKMSYTGVIDFGRMWPYSSRHAQGLHMHIDAHLLKISRLERPRSRLAPSTDFELWFWAAMQAGTHALNAALHHAGLSSEGNAFAMQPGCYLVPHPDCHL